MFFINSKPASHRRDTLFLRGVPAVIVLTVFTVVTFISWYSTHNGVKEEHIALLHEQNEIVAGHITDLMDEYSNLLRGAAALFNLDPEVTMEDWQSYFTNVNLPKEFPAIHGVGYTPIVPPENKQRFIEYMRMQGISEFNIFPEESRSMYGVISYLAPLNESNRIALGFDMYSEINRRTAMDIAQDTGQPTLSDVVSLLQEKNRAEKQPGFLMFMPIYKGGGIPKTVEARREQISGFVYIPFRAHDFINTIVEQNNMSFGFSLSNQHIHQGVEHLYTTANFDQLAREKHVKRQRLQLVLTNKTWVIDGIASLNIVSSDTRSRSTTVLLGGLLLSALVAGSIYFLLSSKTRALARKEEQSIQEAKDELLALASHQLRTPATGVKQYVGMLREGLAGDLTPMQETLVEKAYQSNERQLNTINQMLFVARSDAGHLKMDIVLFDIGQLVIDMGEELKLAAELKNQKVKLVMPKSEYWVAGDRQYIRMALENITSNALKYSYEKGRITITLTASPKKVSIAIKDNGVGVSKDDMGLLFKKFSRVQNALSDKVTGSGIGLYLAKSVIAAHHGSITFDSKEGKGSVVTITLPRKNKKKNKPKKSSELKK